MNKDTPPIIEYYFSLTEQHRKQTLQRILSVRVEEPAIESFDEANEVLNKFRLTGQ
jgi:hypothetical protein